MACPACMLALFADAPRFSQLIQEARSSPHGKVCVCADCRSIMGADSARPARRSLRMVAPLSDFLGGDTSDALAGAGSSSGDLGSVGSSSGGDLGAGQSSGTGIDLAQLAQLAGSVDPNKIAAFVATLAGSGGGAALPPPPPVTTPPRRADDSQIWTVALIVLVFLTFYVLSTQKKKR